MMSGARQALDILRLMPDGGPAVCNICITNVCNATCDFCNFAADKHFVVDRAYIDADRLRDALGILHRRGVRYLTFSGGEPLLHPRIADMVRYAVERGMRPSVVTNGWLLPRKLDDLRAAGLRTLFISIDASDRAPHEGNRGLKGVCDRIAAANAEAARHGIKTIASVTINRLLGDVTQLPAFLASLGFASATFSYPKTAALGSSSLVYSETSTLIDYGVDELAEAFEAVRKLKGSFAILNPSESLREMVRHLRGERETFACFGGYKYFYMDYRFDVYRCDFLGQKVASVWDFADAPLIRDGCTRCMSDCYRDSSVLLNFPVAIGDALRALGRGRPDRAARALAAPAVRRSIGALLEGSGTLKRLARLG
jgi:MoaA/NifB/PqqE/SkfB family radical SAM enzyme